MGLQDHLASDKQARFFPVTADGSKERSAASIPLACLESGNPSERGLATSFGQRVATGAQIERYTRVVFRGQHDRAIAAPTKAVNRNG